MNRWYRMIHQLVTYGQCPDAQRAMLDHWESHLELMALDQRAASERRTTVVRSAVAHLAFRLSPSNHDSSAIGLSIGSAFFGIFATLLARFSEDPGPKYLVGAMALTTAALFGRWPRKPPLVLLTAHWLLFGSVGLWVMSRQSWYEEMGERILIIGGVTLSLANIAIGLMLLAQLATGRAHNKRLRDALITGISLGQFFLAIGWFMVIWVHETVPAPRVWAVVGFVPLAVLGIVSLRLRDLPIWGDGIAVVETV